MYFRVVRMPSMRVFRRFIQSRWRPAPSLWAWSLIALLALTGCGGPQECTPYPTQQPTIVRALGLQFLHFMRTSQYAYGEQQVQGIIEFTPAPTASGIPASSRILVTLNRHLVVLDPVSLQEQPVSGTTCLGIPALSPDHRWVACVSVDGSQSALSGCRAACQGTSVNLMAAQDLPKPRPVTIIGARPADAATGANTYISPIWSPDGRYLAVVHSPAHEPGCLIDIYTFNPARATFALTSALNTDIGGSDFCEIHQIAWSPASPTLALVHKIWKTNGTSTTGVALLRIPSAALGTLRGARTFSVATVSLRAALVAPIQAIWTPSGKALLIDDGGKTLDQIDVAAGRQSTIFSIPTTISNPPELFAMTQAANGASLLLALGYTHGFTAQIAGRQPQPARALIPLPASCLPYPGLPAAIYRYQYSAV